MLRNILISTLFQRLTTALVAAAAHDDSAAHSDDGDGDEAGDNRNVWHVAGAAAAAVGHIADAAAVVYRPALHLLAADVGVGVGADVVAVVVAIASVATALVGVYAHAYCSPQHYDSDGDGDDDDVVCSLARCHRPPSRGSRHCSPALLRPLLLPPPPLLLLKRLHLWSLLPLCAYNLVGNC